MGVMHGLSDHQLQYMLLDRRSFKQFAGLVTEDQVPDQKTLWKYRDLLSKCGGFEELFLSIKDQLLERGYRLNSGQIVDSSIVSIPLQRTSREDNSTRSRLVGCLKIGKLRRTSCVKKMWMRGGRRKVQRITMVTRITSRPTARASSLLIVV